MEGRKKTKVQEMIYEVGLPILLSMKQDRQKLVAIEEAMNSQVEDKDDLSNLKWAVEEFKMAIDDLSVAMGVFGK